MTQEEKNLLLKDLCARLFYGVKGLITVHKTIDENSTFNSVIDGKLYDRFANLQDSWYDNVLSIKPYLRSMSSMTEEEYREFGYDVLRYTPREFDWLNKHHFDYRGLIEKGLALEAPKYIYAS